MPRRPLKARLIPALVPMLGSLPAGPLMRARPLIGRMLGRAPRWRSRVEGAMRAALGDDLPAGAVDRFFLRMADMLVFSMAAWREGIGGRSLVSAYMVDPAAESIYRRSLEAGRGVVMAGPHFFCSELMAGVAARSVPVTVLVRQSPDAAYEAIKQKWYRQLGLRTVYRPRRGAPGEGLAEITSALRVLREGSVLAITPDLVRAPGTGLPVTLFGRRVELPAGAFFLSRRAGAPLLPARLLYEEKGGRYVLESGEALEAGSTDRDEAVRELAAAWAEQFESTLRRQPEMWQFWLDKRWAAWLDGR